MKTPILLLPLLFLFSSPLLAQWHGPNIPDSLSFQGFITDSNGVALNTTADITFRLYKGASQVWTQTKIATEVTDGVFSVILGGSGLQSLDAVAFNEPMDLEIRYGNITLTPRTPLTATAYALGMRGIYAIWDDNGFSKGYNIIGGADINHVPDGTVGATISGGGGWTSLGTTPRPDSVVGDFGTVGGGIHNTAGFAAVVGGGQNNKATGSSSTVSGGQDNVASGQNATVSGGQANIATEPFATVAGGADNEATEWNAFVGGGWNNTASGTRSTIPGGSWNQATGGFSFAAGMRAQANHSGAFVWADSANGFAGTPFASTDINQFLVRAAGGVGIGTNTPSNQLSVTGSADVSGSLGIGTNSPARPLHIRGPNGVLRVDREEASATTIILNQYNAGAPDVSWKSFQINVEADGVNNGTFKIQDLEDNVGGGGAFHDRLTIANDGKIGIGTSDPYQELHVVGDYYGRGHVFLHAYEGDSLSGTAYVQARDRTGSTTIGMTLRTQDAGTTKDAVTIAANGNVNVLGTLSKASGSFKIDHPLDPENKYLYHSFVESPDMKNVYDGNTVLDKNGKAAIELPSYFEALNKDFRYQLTAIGAPGPNLYVAEKISGNQFSIAGGTPGMEVSWQITGIRKDSYAERNRIEVEVEKPASERGTYLHPDGYAGTN